MVEIATLRPRMTNLKLTVGGAMESDLRKCRGDPCGRPFARRAQTDRGATTRVAPTAASPPGDLVISRRQIPIGLADRSALIQVIREYAPWAVRGERHHACDA